VRREGVREDEEEDEEGEGEVREGVDLGALEVTL